MHLKDGVLSEISQSQKEKYCVFHSCEVPGVVECLETESRVVVSRDWGKGMGSCLVASDFPFCKMTSVLPQCVCPAVGLLGHKTVLFPVF